MTGFFFCAGGGWIRRISKCLLLMKLSFSVLTVYSLTQCDPKPCSQSINDQKETKSELNQKIKAEEHEINQKECLEKELPLGNFF